MTDIYSYDSKGISWHSVRGVHSRVQWDEMTDICSYKGISWHSIRALRTTQHSGVTKIYNIERRAATSSEECTASRTMSEPRNVDISFGLMQGEGWGAGGRGAGG